MDIPIAVCRKKGKVKVNSSKKGKKKKKKKKKKQSKWYCVVARLRKARHIAKHELMGVRKVAE
jgi:hypothetical protein